VARSVTVGEIITQARYRADRENDSFFSAAELRTYVSASYARLYMMLVKGGFSLATEVEATITSTGTNAYALPATHLATVGIDYEVATGQYTPLRRLMTAERTHFQSSSGPATGYRLVGSDVILYPTPASGQVYRHVYIAAPAVLDADADTIDGVAGWEEFIVEDVARKMKVKEEGDTRPHDQAIALLMKQIDEEIEDRHLAAPRRVVNADDDHTVIDAADWRFSR
jgi:hypothetical protein